MAPTTRRRTRVVRRLTPRQPIPKDIMIELNPRHDKECMLCGHKEISEKLYGLLYQLNDVVVHYFCILLSSLAVQNGEDKEGIWGFLYDDIKNEILRGSRETCVYCKKMGATITCCGPKCRKTFHLPCGLKNGSMHQYYQTFKSYCKQHRMTQTVDIKDLQSSKPVQCAICKDDVKPTPLPSSLWAPCCKRNSWFHRDCVQGLALSAGYFFKCPLCNDVETFKGRMLHLGIYIPSRKDRYLKKYNRRDASWETVPNAFEELLERHCTCNAVTCLCPHQEKRNYHQESGSWEIILCYTCGSNGSHRLCSSLKCNEIWFCSTCSDVAESPASKKRRLEIKNVSSNGTSTLRQVASSSSQNSNTRRSNVRDVSRNMGTRETTRLNNNSNNNTISNRRRLLRRSRLQTSVLNARQLGEPILISDSDDSSSDVEVICFIEPPRTVIPHPVSATSSQNRLPIISSYSSMNTSTTIVNTYQHRYNILIPQRNIIPRFNDHLIISDTIDLTMDDDDGDNNGNNNANNKANKANNIEDYNGHNNVKKSGGD